MFDNENNMQRTVLFRFLGCEGLGLQQSDSLSKIMADVFQDYFASETLYLLDSKGRIRCSVLADKAGYEAYDNLDRRQSNIANGFNVLWDQDGRSCTIYNRPATKRNMKPVVVAALAAFVAGVLIAWFATWMAMDSRIYEARLEERQRAGIASKVSEPSHKVESDTTSSTPSTMSASIEEEKAAKEGQKYVNEADSSVADAGRRVDLRIEAKTMQSRLQRENCTINTVKNVDTWLRKMPHQDYRIVCEIYPFKKAVITYYHFFDAKNIEDVKELVNKTDIFSKKQIAVLRWYAENTAQFRKRRNAYGMRFDIPDPEISSYKL